MPPVTGISFLLLTLALAVVLVFRASRWPKAAALLLSALATAAVTTAVLFRAVPGFADWESVLDPARLTLLGNPAGQSRYQDAILIALTGFNLCAALWARPVSRWWKTGVGCAAGCALLGFLTLVADTAGNPMFSGAGLLGVTPLAALEFLLLNAGLALDRNFAGQFRAWFLGEEASGTGPAFLREDRLALQFFGVLGCVALVGATYLRIQTRAQREQVANALIDDVGLKATQMVKWRQEREGDAITIWSAPWYQDVTAALASTGLSPEQRTEMERVMSSFLQVYGYRRLTILDRQMRPLYGYPDEPDLTPASLQKVLKGGMTGHLLETPVYTDRSGTLLWGYLVQIRRRYSEETGAYVLIQTDLGVLFPYLQVWPRDNSTGQSVLWVRRGNQVFSLGGLRDTTGGRDRCGRPSPRCVISTTQN